MITLAAPEAAARVLPADTLGIPLGTGQPPAFLRGARRARRTGGAARLRARCSRSGPSSSRRPGVHYLSGFFGPFERALRDAGANISFAPADFRRFAPLLEARAPRVMATAAAPPDADGWCSLSLHAGGTIDELRRAGADPERLLVVEVSERFPRTFGLPPEHRHALHVDEIDVLVRVRGRRRSRCRRPTPADGRRARSPSTRAPSSPTARRCRPASASIPSTIAALLAEGDGGDYGDPLGDVHRRPDAPARGRQGHQPQGPVRRRVGGDVRDGLRGALRAGSHGNDDVAFLPVEIVNSPERDRPQPRAWSRSTARSRSTSTARSSPTRSTATSSPASAAHEDFVAGPGPVARRSARCSACPRPSTVDGELRSRIVPWFDAGAVITTPRHQVDVDRHRVRRRRARGQDRPPARRGAGRDRPPGLPRRAARGGGAGVAGALAPGAGVAPAERRHRGRAQRGWVGFRRLCLRNSSHPLEVGAAHARTPPSMPPFSDVSGPAPPRCRRWPAPFHEMDRADPELPRGRDVHVDVVEEQAGLGGQCEPFQGQRVDLGVWLAHAHECRVDDQLEQLVDRQLRAPAGAPTRGRCS